MKSLKHYSRKTLAIFLICLLALIVFPVALVGMIFKIVRDSFVDGGEWFSDRLVEFIDNLLYID